MDDNLSPPIDGVNDSIYPSKIERDGGDYPPTYFSAKKSTWPCDSFPNFNFENEKFTFTKPEESSKLFSYFYMSNLFLYTFLIFKKN